MRKSPQLIVPVSFSTELDHDVPLPGWNINDESNCNRSNDHMIGKRAADDDVVDDRSAEAPVEDPYANVLKVLTDGSGQ